MTVRWRGGVQRICADLCRASRRASCAQKLMRLLAGRVAQGKKKPVQCVCLKFERSNMSDTPGLEGPHSNDTFSDLPAGYQQV